MGTSISPISSILPSSTSAASSPASSSGSGTTGTTSTAPSAQSQSVLLAELQAQNAEGIAQLFTSSGGDLATLSSAGLSLSGGLSDQSNTDALFAAAANLDILTTVGKNINSANFQTYVLPTLVNTIPGLAQALAAGQQAQAAQAAQASAVSTAGTSTTTSQADSTGTSA